MRLLEVIKAHYKAFLVGAAAIMAVVAIVAAVINAAKTAKINILVAPVDATIKINGLSYKNGTHRVFPGSKHVEISRDGMDTVSFDIDCQSNHTTAINRYLVGAGQDFSVYQKSAESYELLRLLADQNAAGFINHEEQKLTIKEILPINDTQMLSGHSFAKDGMPFVETSIKDVSTNEDCKASICLSVKTNSNKPQDTAKSLLKYYGYDINDFEVSYEE